MSQAIGQHGYTPPSSTPGLLNRTNVGTPAAAHASAPVAASAATTEARAGVSRFASRLGIFMTDRLLPFFRNVTEIFLVAYLVQDVIAMWCPRIITSLKVGRKKSDPQQDPRFRDLPFHEQVRKWVHESVKGLNWPNFAEESKREFATGPGLLIFPWLVMATMRRMKQVRTAGELSYNALNGLSRGFIERIKASPLVHATEVAPTAYQQLVAEHFSGLFADAQMKNHKVEDPALRQKLLESPTVQKLLAESGQKEPTYGHYLADCFKRWTDVVFGGLENAERKKALETLSAEMTDTLTAFNRQYRLEPYEYVRDGMAKRVNSTLLRTDRTWVAYHLEKPQRMPIASVLKDLQRWSDYAEALWKQQRYSTSAGLHKANLVELGENLLKHVVARKGIASVTGTVVAAWYLIRLAAWAQSHNAYQATRLYNRPAPTKAPHHSAGPAQVPPQAATVPNTFTRNAASPVRQQAVVSTSNVFAPPSQPVITSSRPAGFVIPSSSYAPSYGPASVFQPGQDRRPV